MHLLLSSIAPTRSSSGVLAQGAIVGIVVAVVAMVLVGVVVLVVVILLLRRRRSGEGACSERRWKPVYL